MADRELLYQQSLVNDDLKGTPYELKSRKDLELLRVKAQARGEWNNLIEPVTKT